MEYLGCQRAIPREDYDVWEGQGSIAGQFAAVARVIWALVYIPCLLELFFYPTIALGIKIQKYIQCPSKQSVTCDGDYIDDIDDNDDKNDDDDGDVDCKHAVVCNSS